MFCNISRNKIVVSCYKEGSNFHEFSGPRYDTKERLAITTSPDTDLLNKYAGKASSEVTNTMGTSAAVCPISSLLNT